MEKIIYKGKEYSISKDMNTDLYKCENENYRINKEQLNILKQIVSKSKEDKEKEQELVSLYNDMITFNTYQYKPYFKLISEKNKKKCLYIADEVGVGKTFETGIIISELLYSGKIDIHSPILIICPNILCRKWQEVLNTYFGLNSRIVKNLYNISGISIISFNNISKINKKDILDDTKFGMMIIDEAHNVGKRYEKILKLRKQSTFTVLLSATPLSGKNADIDIQKEILFGKNETEENIFEKENIYFNRTLKDQMRKDKVTWNIENCNINNNYLKDYIEIIQNIFKGRNTLKKFVGLNMISSSPTAANSYCGLLKRLGDEKIRELFVGSNLTKEEYENLGYDNIEEILNDYENLEEMQGLFDNIGAEVSENEIQSISEQIENLYNKIVLNDVSSDEKLVKLKEIIALRGKKVEQCDDESWYYKKLVVFVNYNETAKYLNKNIDNSILINGSICTDEKLTRFEEFKKIDSGKDVLIITNVACEGLDMDFCNAIVNYDLTYNPIQLAQRKGRIDRFKITCKEKYIYNFINKDVDPDDKAIEDIVKGQEFVSKYSNSVYTVLIRKLKAIKDETGIYYNVIDSIGKTNVNGLESNTESTKQEEVDCFKRIYGDEIQGFDSIEAFYKNKRENRYKKVNDLLELKQISVSEGGDKVVIEVNKNNREFLKYVYDGGTINSHLIYNK